MGCGQRVGLLWLFEEHIDDDDDDDDDDLPKQATTQIFKFSSLQNSVSSPTIAANKELSPEFWIVTKSPSSLCHAGFILPAPIRFLWS